MSSVVTSASFFFRAPTLPRPAAELLAEIRERGGRVYRMQARGPVFCLTDNPELADWLYGLGARPYAPRAYDSEAMASFAPGAFAREHGGKVEYDLWVNPIPVEGSIWDELG